MSKPESRRLIRVAGWLLAPIVAWAASFLVSWLGARIALAFELPGVGLYWLVGGAVVGAALGLVGWIWIMRRYSRLPGNRQGKPRGR